MATATTMAGASTSTFTCYKKLPQEIKDAILKLAHTPLNIGDPDYNLVVAFRHTKEYENVKAILRIANFNLTAENAKVMAAMRGNAISKINHLRIAWGSDKSALYTLNSSSMLWKLRNSLTSISLDLTSGSRKVDDADFDPTITASDVMHMLKWLCAASVSGVEYLDFRFDDEPNSGGFFLQVMAENFGYDTGRLIRMGKMDKKRRVWTWGDGVMKLKILKK